jgi:hypothetical protein
MLRPLFTVSYANNQGYQMVYLHTKNSNLGILWKALEWKMLVYFTAVWSY